MSPDDPRHGSNAGAIAHWRDGEKPCAPCSTASNRLAKGARFDAEQGRPRTTILGARAHKIVVNIPADQLARATGIGVHKLSRMRYGGPATPMRRSTRDRIIRAAETGTFWTPVGLQRRLRSLHFNGWSARAIAAETIADYEAIKRLVRDGDRAFVRRAVADDVLDVFKRLGDQIAPPSASASRARNTALRSGWWLADEWLDIDHDDEPEAADDEIDSIVIDRILGGDFSLARTAAKAERVEIVARWRADGRSLNELERASGWNVKRYYETTESEGAA